jgi:hypothetical protein
MLKQHPGFWFLGSLLACLEAPGPPHPAVLPTSLLALHILVTLKFWERVSAKDLLPRLPWEPLLGSLKALHLILVLGGRDGGCGASVFRWTHIYAFAEEGRRGVGTMYLWSPGHQATPGPLTMVGNLGQSRWFTRWGHGRNPNVEKCLLTQPRWKCAFLK